MSRLLTFPSTELLHACDEGDLPFCLMHLVEIKVGIGLVRVSGIIYDMTVRALVDAYTEC